MTQADIAAFSLVAFAIIAAVASVMTKVHTDIVPGIKALVSDIRDIRAIATDARQTAALAAQQSDQNSQRLNGQSAKIDLVNNKVTQVNDSVLLATTPPVVDAPPVANPSQSVDAPPVVNPSQAVDAPAILFNPVDAPIDVTAPAVVPAPAPMDAPHDAPIILAARAALDAHAVPNLDLDPNRADIIRAIQALVNTTAPADTPGAGQTATTGTVDPANVVIAPPPAVAYAPVNV